MKRSDSRILTTHTGSLPRSLRLQELLREREDRREYDPGAFADGVREGVAEVVARQQSIGIDVVNDGEQGRSQYATYVKERLSGFEGERMIRSRPAPGRRRLSRFRRHADPLLFPQYTAACLHRPDSLEGLACGFAGHRELGKRLPPTPLRKKCS